eukprot:3656242-Lingulodinium_polyedra.AAC.1
MPLRHRLNRGRAPGCRWPQRRQGGAPEMPSQREPPAPRNGRRPSTGCPTRAPAPSATVQRAQAVAAPRAG